MNSGNKMAEKQSRRRAFILGLAVVAALAIFLWQGRGQAPGWLKQKIAQISPRSGHKQSVPVGAPSPAEVPSAKSTPIKDEVLILNDKGVDLVLQKQYWPAIFLFKQAMDLDQSRIEPVMNMAVTLEEIGLSRPAARYLAMAETLNPDYVPLRINRQNRKDRMAGVSHKQSPELPHGQKP